MKDKIRYWFSWLAILSLRSRRINDVSDLHLMTNVLDNGVVENITVKNDGANTSVIQ